VSEFACGALLPFAKLLKGLGQLVVLLQKVIGYPFDPFACGNRELHATQSMLAIYRWENFFSNKKMAASLKNPFTIRGPYTYQDLSNNTTFRPI
jgi:hypothetical protein